MTLTISHFAKTYPDGTRALLPTDLEVGTGEILSLLGPSGCGKTTLLRLIAGLETPDAGGLIRFDEDDVTKVPVEKRAIGMVFQSYALFPNMSVRQNIGYGLRMQKLDREDVAERVESVMGLCQLTRFADRRVDALSGGQRQRVALARAFAPRPRILLLDEPLSALDAALRDELRDELAELLRRFEITAIFVTHDQHEALAIADRVAVMSEGRIAQIGTPEELYRNPASPFVAEFVGNAMVLDGTLNGDVLSLTGGDLHLPPRSQATMQDIKIYVRQEDVKLDRDGPLTGTVSSAVFLGTHYRLALSGVTNSILHCQYQGSSAPRIGDNVRVTIDKDAIKILASSQP